jgi:formylglycine-generating enzyme required for sulfatase activity
MNLAWSDKTSESQKKSRLATAQKTLEKILTNFPDDIEAQKLLETAYKLQKEQTQTPSASTNRRISSRLPLAGGAVVVAVLLLALLAWSINGGSIGAGDEDEPTPTRQAVAQATAAPTATPTPLPTMIEIEVEPGVTMKFLQVPTGPFLMGSSDDDPYANDDETPQHELTLPNYYIGRTEVTNAQFRPFVEGDGYTNPDYWSDDGWTWREVNNRTQPSLWNEDEFNGDRQPVVGVSWYEAMAYARWLSAQTSDDYRLPTEAEWEKAACGTEGQIYPWGNEWKTGLANSFESTRDATTTVGNYPIGRSPYGALDMSGNVWEWTRSKYRDYPYDPDDGRENINNPEGTRFVLRGGSWVDPRTRNRCVFRGWDQPYANYLTLGFRIIQFPHSFE